LVTTARQTPVWVVAGEGAAPDRVQALAARGVEVLQAPSAGDGKLDLAAVLELLARRGITRVMTEAGPILATAFLRADLVDAAALFRASTPIGSDGIDALDGLPLPALTRSPKLKSIGSEAVGPNLVEMFERA
jgi:diaminohydroxyphosphoribosylaminopyrimidine deaminase/5-amino-6-(5-phosphoribosylamino)uracil reductase